MNVVIGVVSPAAAWVLPRPFVDRLRARVSRSTPSSTSGIARRCGARCPTPTWRSPRSSIAICVPSLDQAALGAGAGGRRRPPAVRRARREPDRADERARRPRPRHRRARARRDASRWRASCRSSLRRAGRAPSGRSTRSRPRGAVRTLHGRRHGDRRSRIDRPRGRAAGGGRSACGSRPSASASTQPRAGRCPSTRSLPPDRLLDLLARSDVVVLSAALTPETDSADRPPRRSTPSSAARCSSTSAAASSWTTTRVSRR